MQIALFGPDIYQADKEIARRLSGDMRLVSEFRKTWNPAMAPGLFDARSPVGTYDIHMRSTIVEESKGWARELKEFPNVSLPLDSPARLGLVARDNILLSAMAEVFPIPDTPFWNGVAEQVYGFTWCLVDINLLCRKCVQGACSSGVLACFPDYFHFRGDLFDILDMCANRVTEYINHVHSEHPVDGPERKVMDAWVMCVQSVYLDILHPKAERLRFPDDELRSIRYRLINSAGRALALQARLEQDTPLGDNKLIDAIAFTSTVMHDICDLRHDNSAHEFYNLLTIVTGHTGMPSVDMIRRFCVDTWAWAIDNGAFWAIHLTGRELAWQIYMARYQTAILLDNLQSPDPSQPRMDPYGDLVLNNLNPLPASKEPLNFSIRCRCKNKARYDQLLHESLKHFNCCPGCRDYDSASWQERVRLIGAAYLKKYTNSGCLNTICTYMILTSPNELWWLADPKAQYTGPTSEWSSLLC